MSSFTAAAHRRPGYTHILLITTGSVASIKVPQIANELLRYKNVAIQVVATKSSLVFYDWEGLQNFTGVTVWQDEKEWQDWQRIGDPILHIELRRWADIVIIAPCSANTLAKIANGICDNLATSVLRALSHSTPTYVFPAMNTAMYEHPLTAKHIRTLRETIGYWVSEPTSKALACGDVGVGAMTEWKDIVTLIVARFALTK